MITNKLLKQPKVLTYARYSYTEYEMRIFIFIILHLQKAWKQETLEDLENWRSAQTIQFHLADLKINDNEVINDRIKKALISIRAKSFTVETEHEWFNTGLINYGHYDKKIKKYEIQISNLLAPHIIELGKNFTQYQLNVILKLNFYGQRLYIIMNDWAWKGYYTTTAKDFKKLLEIDKKYQKYYDFKKAVITRAQNELKNLYDEGKADLYFILTEDKIKRKSDDDFDRTLKFKIITKDEKITNQEDLQLYMQHCTEYLKKFFPKQQKRREDIYKFLFNSNLIVEFMEKVYKIIENLEDKKELLHNHGGLINTILREDFRYTK